MLFWNAGQHCSADLNNDLCLIGKNEECDGKNAIITYIPMIKYDF